MGKATIISGGTDGRYTIKIDAGSQQQASRLETIETSLASVLERIPEAQAEYLAATTKETYAAGALNAAIENYAAAVQANPETASTADVDRLTGDYYTAASFAGEARTRLQSLLLQQRQLEGGKAALASAPASETRQAWCADLTEDAAGEVATIEVPGEPGTVLVAPGGRAPSAGDGALLARELMTPEQAFFNAAILPGWQKWMPTFRTGTITAVNSDNDTADVSLDAATSSAQGLGANQTSSLSGVPVDYMECNAAAFEVGDPCVVRFDGQSWDAPRVIGFAREPKGCQNALIAPQWRQRINETLAVFIFPKNDSKFTIEEIIEFAHNKNLDIKYKINNSNWLTFIADIGSTDESLYYTNDRFFDPYVAFSHKEFNGFGTDIIMLFMNFKNMGNMFFEIEAKTKNKDKIFQFKIFIDNEYRVRMKPVMYAGSYMFTDEIIKSEIYRPLDLQ